MKLKLKIDLDNYIEENKKLKMDLDNYIKENKKLKDELLKANKIISNFGNNNTNNNEIMNLKYQISQKDIEIANLKYQLLEKNNETLKNNLTMLNSKIEEVRNAQQIKEGNDLMKELGSLDTGETLRQNIENVMMENQRQVDIIKIMQNGNNALNSDLGIQNPDDYLKSLLGTAGAPPAY